MDEIAKDEIAAILRRLYIGKLKALLGVGEIERVALNFELGSPKITAQRKAEAIARRDAVMVEWGERMTELAELESGEAGASFQHSEGNEEK